MPPKATTRQQLGLRLTDKGHESLALVQAALAKDIKAASGIERAVSQSQAVERALVLFLEHRKGAK